MKRIVVGVILIAVLLMAGVVVGATGEYTHEFTFCSGSDVYSIDYVCSLSGETVITSVKISDNSCIYDWNYVKSEARLYISLASAEPISNAVAVLTITTEDDIEMKAISVVANGKTKIRATHKEEEIPAVEATPENSGSTAGIKCSSCGLIIKEPEEVIYVRPTIASGECGNNLTWTLYTDGELVIEGTGAMWDFGNLDNKAPWRAYIDKLIKLTISDGVTTIGDMAFYECGDFTGNLVIPDSVTMIGNGSFSYCSGFTGDLVIPDSVESIGSYAFADCSGFTGNLVISTGVQIISGYTFSGCSGFTGDLVIPDNVDMIGEGAFYGCSGFKGTLAISKRATKINSYAFYDCTGFTGDLVLPESITAIGDYAFYGCGGFTGDLVIPDSVTTIGEWAFFICRKLTGHLIIGNSVTTIGDFAFRSCSGFTGELVIPESVTTIGSGAFRGCGGIAKATIYSEATTFGTGVFDNTNSDFTIHGYKGSTVKTYANENGHTFVAFRKVIASGNCGDNLTWTIYDDGELIIEGTGEMWGYDSTSTNYITSAPWSEYHNQLTKLTLTEGVTAIGKAAFAGCSSFTGELVIPGSVTTIGNEAFANCSGFTGDLVIYSSVKTVGELAFYGCNSMSKALIYPKEVIFGADVFKNTSPNFIINGYTDSTIRTYANENEYLFELLVVKVNVNESIEIDRTVSEQLVTLNHDTTCRVGYVSDGKRVTAEAHSNDSGSYDFQVPEGICEVVLVIAGDISDDGVIDNEDKTAFADAIMANDDELTPEQFFAADINGDGRVDIIDLVLFAKSMLDEDNTFHKDLEW